MSLSDKPPINLRINQRAKRSVKAEGPVRLTETAADHPTPATRSAEKLVAACRENVRFLNFHLQPYGKFIELPTLVNNALYLAYTIRVRDDSPLDALTLRKKLAEAGIETSSAFSFTASPEESYSGKAIERIKGRSSRSDLDTQAFCLGCHQYLTILDLEHVINTFESIFGCFGDKAAKSSQNHNRENGS
jgi:dTDP-4-amino-4,6-dideoxygalactose transaminase